MMVITAYTGERMPRASSGWVEMGLAEKQQELQQTYQENLKKGMTPKEAAVDAQSRTGLAMRTSLPIKGDSPRLPVKRVASRAGKGFGIYGV